MIQKCGVSRFLKEMNTFIQQGCIEFIKKDSKDIYKVAKYLSFK